MSKIPTDPYRFSHLDVDEDEAAIRAFFRFFWIDWSPARSRSLEKSAGMPRSSQIILQRLFQEKRMTTTALAAGLLVDRSTLSRQLSPLKEAGLVDAEHVGGGRRTELTLTTAGEKRAIELDALVMTGYSEALAQLKPERVHQLANLLSEFRLALAMTQGLEEKAPSAKQKKKPVRR
jgi:DNA-binding MarR family transcriptional regulator